MSLPAAPTKLSRELFEQLNKSGIDYCHWKSNIRLDESLCGLTDLDLLVARADATRFTSLICELGFKALRPRGWELHPAMEDYVGLDGETGRMLHLHIHYQLILGEANLKSYRIPLESLLLEGNHTQLGVRVPAPEAELYVYLLRLAAKSSRLPRAKSAAQLLTRDKSTDDCKELEYLRGRADATAFGELLDRTDVTGAGRAAFDEILAASASERPARLADLRYTLAPFRRFGTLYGGFRSMGKLLLDAGATAARSNKKALVTGGTPIAIVGCDGAGKSTLVDAIIQRMRWKIRAKHYYLGSNTKSYTWRTRAAIAISVPFRAIKKLFPSFYHAQVCGYIGRFLIEYNSAIDRLSRYRSGMRDAANGAVVIFERFPLPRVMDWPLDFEEVPAAGPEMPRAQRNALASPLVRRLAATLFEKYKPFDLPPLVLYLDIPDSAIDVRRPIRDDFIRGTILAKNDRMRRYYIDNETTAPIQRIDATKSPEAVVTAALNHIWKTL